MNDDMSEYEIYAIRYASKDDRRSSENFIENDAPDIQMPLDFFVWALVSPNRTVIVDTGFDEKAGNARNYAVTRPVAEGLKQIGINPDNVKDVILTHMHWDHAGNRGLFSQARYHVQEREMHFCTGRCMCDAQQNKAYNAEDVSHIVRRNFEGSVTLHDPNSDFDDGISLHWLGGHTAGLQVVRVKTRRGHVVLASDASHYYANILQRRPFPVLFDMNQMLNGFAVIQKLADSPSHIIPGHDRQVLSLFPAAREGLDGIARLDADPIGRPA
ncbi:N-acyl homoserine lactonase family protein [Bradyrhizobium prioriisuperbiae]|uniref:N-acyl homoserine lactonase family protein n=1 Tax=Bradyrhizobium prioriisuperbiae TaxID=2854389 RepID=UPI0028E4B6E0|nr:N-acyl homoserine lactonase family protein [Bradyrhizobium prioritasuperba]